MGDCPMFSKECDYSPENIQKEVMDFMKEKHPQMKVIYVNVTYDIAEIFDLIELEQDLQNQKKDVDHYMTKNNVDKDEYRRQSFKFKEIDDFPQRKKQNCCWKGGPEDCCWGFGPSMDFCDCREDLPLEYENIDFLIEDTEKKIT